MLLEQSASIGMTPMIINAEHHWSLIETFQIRKQDAFDVIFETTTRKNEPETKDILDSASAAFGIQLKAMRLLASSADRAEHGDRVSLLIDTTNMASTRWGPDSLLRLPVVDGGFVKEDDLPTIPHELGELYCELGPLLFYLSCLESALPPSLLRGPELDLVGLIEQGEDILGDGDAELLLDGNGPLLNR